MELWQWIASDETQLRTWLGQAEIPELIVPMAQAPFVEKLVQMGSCLQASCLVFPLVWSVKQNEILDMALLLPDLKKTAILPHWSFQIAFHKDDGCAENVMDAHVSALKIISVFGEFTSCLAEIIEQLGWDFLSFSKSLKPGFFSLTLAKPEVKTLGDLVRGLMLMRAAIEILSCARGFQLASFELCFAPLEPVTIDHTLARTLKEHYA